MLVSRVLLPEEQMLVSRVLLPEEQKVLAPEEQHVYSPKPPKIYRSVRSGMFPEPQKHISAPLERSDINGLCFFRQSLSDSS